VSYFNSAGEVVVSCCKLCLEIESSAQTGKFIAKNVVFCSAIRCITVNVEYRLAPEHKFPVYLDDGCTVARWVLDNKAAVGEFVLYSIHNYRMVHSTKKIETVVLTTSG
jgi:hypothetical protein